MSIFVDTGAWYAVADASDRHHAVASRFYTAHAGRTTLVTSALVVGETWTLLAARLGRRHAVAFWQILRDTRTPVLTPEPVDLEAAWRIVQGWPDQAFSFVDCTSFALMERLGIEEAFAFDAHFSLYRYGTGRRRAFTSRPG